MSDGVFNSSSSSGDSNTAEVAGSVIKGAGIDSSDVEIDGTSWSVLASSSGENGEKTPEKVELLVDDDDDVNDNLDSDDAYEMTDFMSGGGGDETGGVNPSFLSVKWDPDDLSGTDQAYPPSHTCIRRIKNDIMAIYSDPPPGLCVVPDPNNITKIHALVTGPFDTPYEGGFFYFLIRFPPDYPISPPRVRLMTTGGDTVRFNPNLYKNGKVCLSILGTWAGPSWSPAQTLSTVLISIQSLMNEKPYHNEPGFKHERTSGASKHYNNIIQHETIRVAVCEMIDGCCKLPDSLRAVMESSFPDYYQYYIQVCESHIHLDGTTMNDPFGDSRPKFDFGSLLKRLKAIFSRLDSNISHSDSEPDEDEDTKAQGGKS